MKIGVMMRAIDQEFPNVEECYLKAPDLPNWAVRLVVAGDTASSRAKPQD